MAEARVTWYFGQGQSGWSETLYFPGGRSTSFYAKLETITNARVNMLAANHNLIAVRVTDEGANRFTRLIKAGGKVQLDDNIQSITLPGRGGENGTGSDVEGPPDQLRAALHVEMIKDGQRIGLRYLAGIPDDISLTEPGTLNRQFNKVWYKLFNLWRRHIIDDGWAIKALDKGTGFPLINVISYRIRTAAPSVLGVVIPLAATFTLGTGRKVALQGVTMTRRGLDTPNGQWIIDGTDTDTPGGIKTIWLRGTEGFDPNTFLTLGKIRGVSAAYIVPTWLEPTSVGVHKRGKPFGSPVGRRKTR